MSHETSPNIDDQFTINEENDIYPKRMKKPRRIRCKLDDRDCLNLQDILFSFNGPVSSEQAWALCYQAAKALCDHSSNNLYEICELSDVFLHKDGHVWLDPEKVSKFPPVLEQQVVFSLGHVIFKALDFGLGEEEERPLSPDLETLVMSMTDPSQVQCHPNVEEPLQETDDEGIERDSGDGDLEESLTHKSCNISYDANSHCLLRNVICMCEKRIQGSSEQADAHYKAVIRAFVAEALELSQFLETVTNEKYRTSVHDSLKHETMSQLDTYDFNDWARFWVQVVGELRRGVKLKKVEENLNRRGSNKGLEKGAEFELTPYEILMDDIRERRYRLKKTPAPLPHLRKDARAVILEFIKSRPSLKKASDRKLPPLKKESTLRELLMESIKKPPKPLRPCKTRRVTSPLKEVPSTGADIHNEPNFEENGTKSAWHTEDTTSSTSTTVGQPRKLIPVDFDLKLDIDDDDDDDDVDDEFEISKLDDDDEDQTCWRSKAQYSLDEHGRRREMLRDDEDEKNSANPWRRTGGLRLTKNEYHRFCDTQLEFYDLATQCPSRRASMRKHATRGSLALPFPSTGTTSMPHSRPQSRQRSVIGSNLSPGQSSNLSLNTSPSMSPQPRARPTPRPRGLSDKDSQDRGHDASDKTSEKNLLADMFLDERLSLTLEEIVHIRSVLTKAELESLPVEGRVKEDVEKRRVCFLCLKTRFGILGPWGQRCRLCDRTVCVKCYTKMRIPTEHFAHVPVVLLSPGLLSPISSESDSKTKSSWSRPVGAIGSAPASPASRRHDSLRSGTPTTPGTVSTNEKRSYGSPSKLANTTTFGLNSEQRLAAERLRGVSMVVCHDCRIMVIQIIKSSRTTRATIRNNVISRLTLNLSPAYV